MAVPPPAVIRTDRSDVSAMVSRTFGTVNDGTTKESGHRLLFRDCPRRSRYYLVDFSYALLHQLVTEILKTFLSGTNNAGRR